MLRSVLSPETCAKCRNCCVFESQSAWELPTFCKAAAARLADLPTYCVTEAHGRCRITLPYDATGAAQPCPFLDSDSGCTLPPEEKPFACSVWPLRLMRCEDGTLRLALYRGCPGIPSAEALAPLLDSGLRERMLAEAAADPTLIVPYHPNYDLI